MISHERLFRFSQFLILCLLLSFPLKALATDENAGVSQGFFNGSVGIGYGSVSTDGEPARAGEYSYLHSSVTGSASVHGWKDMRSFSLLADYGNEADYHAELQLNNRGKLRLWLRAESMFHNLDHLPFDEVNRPDAYKATGRWVNFEDLDPTDDYSVKVEQYGARIRAKMGNYPAHFDLTYWRLERSGQEQLRYLDHGGDDPARAGTCNECHVRSQNRTLDRVTEEVKGSVNAHLGYVDVIAEQLYREFRDGHSIPVDSFGSTRRVASGNYQHDEAPDSRLLSTTLRVHTSLSGGISGAASFTVGKRENLSDLSDVRKVKSETDFRKGTADATWILSPHWTVTFRYRLLDMDNSNSDLLVSASEADRISSVRHNVDLTRATYLGRVAYRPSRNWTFKGEFERKEIHRGNTDAATLEDPDPVWELPEDENINRARMTFLGRPLGTRRLKINAWYEYLTSDDPAYGSSAEESHEGFAGLQWSPADRFGINMSVRGKKQLNENQTFTRDLNVFSEDRRNENTNIIAGLWWNPLEKAAITLNYGFLRTRTSQDLIFGGSSAGYFVQDDDLENLQKVHTATAGVDLRIMKNLGARLEGRYIRTFANWDPRFSLEAPSGVPVNSDGLDETTRLDILQTGATFGLDWSLANSWTWSLKYSYDDYEDRDSNLFDGTVQTYLASVSRSW